MKKYLFAVLIVLVIVFVFIRVKAAPPPNKVSVHTQAATRTVTKTPATTKPVAAPTPAVAPPQPAPSICSSNTSGNELIVSINQRHMWACESTKQVYETAVITGMENIAADLTPTGTYKIYAKTTDLYLNGSDSTGSWHDYVHYWMPFLNNQYGTYGFHDATWRADNDFGSISPYSDQASHGRVELPLAAANWLYGWASVGTTISITT